MAAVGAAVGFGGAGLSGGAGLGATPTATPEQGLDIRIGYDGEWRFSLEVTVNGSTEERALTGEGVRVIELDRGATRVWAAAQKLDDSNAKLTLQLVKDGEIVDSGSTSESYGFIRVEASF